MCSLRVSRSTTCGTSSIGSPPGDGSPSRKSSPLEGATVADTSAPPADRRVAAGGAPLLIGRGLQKAYGSTTVLKAVDVTVNEGEVLAVVGENGAGKSTLMKILAGVIGHGDYEGTVDLAGDRCEFTSLRAGE